MGWVRRFVVAGLLAAAAAVVAGVLKYRAADPPVRRPAMNVALTARTAPREAGPPDRELRTVVAPKPARSPDDERREKLAGVWKQNYTGVRWLRIRPDGTATMFIDPDWSAKLVIGNSLTMQIEWTVEEGRALFKSVSGDPESAFKAVNALFGRDRNRPIVELTDRRFVLLDEEDGSKSEWDRVGEGEKVPKAVAD